MMTAAENAGAPVLILTPVGRDASLAASALEDAAFESAICSTLPELIDRINSEVGAVLLAKEALAAPELERLKDCIAAQPPWSDLPLLILTHGGHAEDASIRILGLLGVRANITLIERPMRSSTLSRNLSVKLYFGERFTGPVRNRRNTEWPASAFNTTCLAI
jgi:hypothetical protein